MEYYPLTMVVSGSLQLAILAGKFQNADFV